MRMKRKAAVLGLLVLITWELFGLARAFALANLILMWMAVKEMKK